MRYGLSEEDIILLGLLYRKIYGHTDMISYDKLIKYKLEIEKKFLELDIDVGFVQNFYCQSNIYFKVLGEDGCVYVVLSPFVDAEIELKKILGYLPIDMYIVLEMDDVLKKINLVMVDGIIKDINLYYNELREKYHVLNKIELKRDFDIFLDWEELKPGTFTFLYCISENDKNIFFELSENREKNRIDINKKINSLVRIKK